MVPRFGLAGIEPAHGDQTEPEVADFGQQPMQRGLVSEQPADDRLLALAGGHGRHGVAGGGRTDCEEGEPERSHCCLLPVVRFLHRAGYERPLGPGVTRRCTYQVESSAAGLRHEGAAWLARHGGRGAYRLPARGRGGRQPAVTLIAHSGWSEDPWWR